jgi:hypothetical protein
MGIHNQFLYNEDVTWDRWDIHNQQQAGAVLAIQRKCQKDPSSNAIHEGKGHHRKPVRGSGPQCQHGPKKHSISLCIQPRAEGETPEPPLLGHNKVRCAFQAPLPTRDLCGVRPLPPIGPLAISQGLPRTACKQRCPCRSRIQIGKISQTLGKE